MNKNKKMKLFFIPVVATLLLSGCDGAKTAAESVESADALIASSKTNAAIIELKNAIKTEPQNKLVRYTLGKIYLEQGDVLSAIKELRKAMEFPELENKVYPLLAKAYQLNADERELLSLEDLSSNLNEISKLQIAVYTSILYSQKGDLEKAKTYLADAVTISEENVYSQLANAWLKNSNKELADATKIVQNIVGSSPELSDALLLQGHLFSSKSQFLQAAESYQAFSKQHPKQHQVKIFIANNLLSAGENDKADKVVSELLTLFPKHPNVNQLKAQISYSSGDYENAKVYADVALQSSKLPMAKLLLGLSAYQLKEFELAYQSIRTVISLLPQSHPVHKLFASLQLQLGYQNDAINSFKQLKGLTGNDGSLLQNASMAFAQAGDNDMANSLVDKALELSPENADLVLQKGMLKLRVQDQAGLKIIEKALALDPSLKVANVTLAMDHISKGEFAEALVIAKNWQQTSTGNIQGLLLEGAIYTRQLHFEQATKIFEEVLEKDLGNISAHYYLGLISLNSQSFDKASDHFQSVLIKSPTHFGALQHLIWSTSASEKQDELEHFFSELREKFPQTLALILAQATNYSTQNKNKEAIDFLVKYKDSDIVNEDYWMALANLYQKNKQTKEVIDVYKKLLNDNIKNVNARLALLTFYAENRNYSAVVSEASSGIEVDPDNLKYKFVKAKFLLKQNKLTPAKVILDVLSKTLLSNTNLQRLQADYAYRAKDYAKAESILKSVYKTSKIEHHLLEYVKVLRKTAKQSEAIKELESFLISSPDSSLSRVVLAQLQIKESPQKALNEYYKLLEKSPDNVVLLNNTALTELNLQYNKKALQHAKKAVELMPSNPKVIDTYGQTLLKNLQKEEALASFLKAHNLAKGDEEIALHYGQALAELGHLEQLKVFLANRITSDPKLNDEYKKLQSLIN